MTSDNGKYKLYYTTEYYRGFGDQNPKEPIKYQYYSFGYYGIAIKPPHNKFNGFKTLITHHR